MLWPASAFGELTRNFSTEEIMRISDLLVSEFDEETKKTRATLERVPDKPDFVPHSKSMPLGRLAPHVAELGGFGLSVLTTPGLDFAQVLLHHWHSSPPLSSSGCSTKGRPRFAVPS